jgi:hypothetical protein
VYIRMGCNKGGDSAASVPRIRYRSEQRIRGVTSVYTEELAGY